MTKMRTEYCGEAVVLNTQSFEGGTAVLTEIDILALDRLVASTQWGVAAPTYEILKTDEEEEFAHIEGLGREPWMLCAGPDGWMLTANCGALLLARGASVSSVVDLILGRSD